MNYKNFGSPFLVILYLSPSHMFLVHFSKLIVRISALIINSNTPIPFQGKLLGILGVPLMRAPSSHMNGESHHEFN